MLRTSRPKYKDARKHITTAQDIGQLLVRKVKKKKAWLITCVWNCMLQVRVWWGYRALVRYGLCSHLGCNTVLPFTVRKSVSCWASFSKKIKKSVLDSCEPLREEPDHAQYKPTVIAVCFGWCKPAYIFLSLPPCSKW